MRMRWARGLSAALVLCACARDGRDTRPPHDGGTTAVAATKAPPEAPGGPAGAPSVPVPVQTDPEPAPGSTITEPEPDGPVTTLGPPTEEEFRAWDRKDPEAEAELDAWDREHLDRMLRTFDELRCFHQAVLVAGERLLADPRNEPQWHDFKRKSIPELDAWLKRFFADNPRILEKSRFVSHFLEAHELVSFTYIRAYNDGERAELDEHDAHWFVVESKVRKRAQALGGQLAASPVRCDPPAAR
jgi:hypothetical protein